MLRAKFLLQLFGFFILLFFINKVNVDIHLLRHVFRDYNLLLIILLIFLGITVKSILWKYIVKEILNLKISLPFSVISTISGISSAAVIPGRLDLAKSIILKETHGSDLSSTLGAVAFEKLIYLKSILISFFFFLFLLPEVFEKYHLLFYIVSLMFSTIFYLLYFNAKILLNMVDSIILFFNSKGLINSSLSIKLREPFSVLINQKKSFIIITTLITLFSLAVEVIRVVFIFEIIGISISYSIIGFTYCFTHILTLMIFIPGGVGVHEVSQSTLISEISLHNDSDLISNAILIFRLIFYYSIVIIGAIFMIYFPILKTEKADSLNAR